MFDPVIRDLNRHLHLVDEEEMYQDAIDDLMQQFDCSYEEAKKILKKEQDEALIDRYEMYL